MLETRICTSLDQLDATAWNTLLAPGNPFMDYRFLAALEHSGCVGHGTAWQPHFLTLRQDGMLMAALPLYLRRDSYGEFIFDWQWADAFHRSGIPYYPKATVATPFTPAAGQRLLLHPDAGKETEAQLIQTALSMTGDQQLSGLHVLFCTREECKALSSEGMLSRLTYQFHWENRGYRTFDDFLADLRSKKRKQLKKERRVLAESDLEIRLLAGDDIGQEHIDAMWGFYIRNQADKFGNAYLNRDWFELIYETMREHLVMTIAFDNQIPIAGTLNFRKDDHLYGRYWGCSRHVEFLHFECCYYQLIDYAIAEGITLFEAGAQGEHKFLRGFATRPTYSAHWFRHPDAMRVIGDYLDEETRHAETTILGYNRQSPLKHIRDEANQLTVW